jgi:hypothetical protein
MNANPRPAYIGATMLVVVALFLGFFAQPVYEIAFRAGNQLTDPSIYITAVLGEQNEHYANEMKPPSFPREFKLANINLNAPELLP